MKLINLLFSGICVLFISQSALAFQDSETTESDRLNEWFNEKYEEQIQMSPLQLTVMGRKERYGEIDQATISFEKEVLDWRAATVRELEETFDYDELDDITKMSYDLWIYQHQAAVSAFEYTRYSYVFSQMMGIHSQIPNMMINFHRVDEAIDMDDYISRIEAISTLMDQLIERSQEQAEMGIRPPRFSYEIVIDESKEIIKGAPFTDSENPSPILQDAERKINVLLEREAINTQQAAAFKSELTSALLDHFGPAYESLITWLTEDMVNAEEAPTGYSRHPNGVEYYNYQLRTITTTDLTADEIHQIGLDEVARIHSEMEIIKEAVGFDGTLQEFFDFTDTDEEFFYLNDDSGREEYIEDADAFLKEINKKLPDYFGILPKADLIVKRVESFREQDGAPQHYFPGTPDGSRPGIFYAHLSDMSSMPKPPMEAIAYHEGNPGHHMQVSIAQELTSVPMFRTQTRQIAYVEGWALYSELLSKEMGQYENPYSDFGRLSTELWRAIRLVVDTGIHSKGWTEEEAFNYFSENSPTAEGAIRAEVRRYMVWPGQATAYKIGMIKILELREYAKDELGDKFDIRNFHDTILGNGSLPLTLLEKRVNQWIAETK